MLKKILLFCLVALAMSGCDDELKYDATERVLYQGRITDANGAPLANIPVGVYITKDGYYGWYGSNDVDTDLISYTTTDANGNYKMLYPQPTNQDNIALLINQDNRESAANTTYSSTVIQNLKPDNLTDYKIDFAETRLFEIANSTTLQVNFDNAGYYNLGKINYSGLINGNVIDYNYSLPIGEDDNYYYDFASELTVAKNQTVTLKYQTLASNGVSQIITNHEVQITIGSEPVIYTLEF